MSGWQRTGTLRIPAEHSMRRSAVTSVSALPNNFEFIFKEEHLEHWKTQFDFSARLRACGAACPGTDHARRYARRGHDLKLLSLRGETTPRTPVWRSKS